MAFGECTLGSFMNLGECVYLVVLSLGAQKLESYPIHSVEVWWFSGFRFRI